MTNTRIHVYAILFVLFLTIIVLLSFFNDSRSASAAAPPGLHATIATSTSPAVTAGSAIVLIATSTCMARIISTASTSLMLTFSDYAGQTPTASFGVFQAASTTVTYDGATYGCGLVKGYAFGTGNITVIDSR